MQSIQKGLSSASTTPTRRGGERNGRALSSLSGQPAGPPNQAIDRGPYYLPSNDLGGLNEALFNASPASSSTTANTPQDEINAEDEFWTSPLRPAERPPRGEFSAVDYRPGDASKSGYARNAMLTPPRSSPIRNTDIDSPSSTFQVSELLREAPDPEEDPETAVNGHVSPFESDLENTFNVRASPAGEQPADCANSAGTQHKFITARTVREHLAALNSLPDQIEKLERKQRAAEQSAHKKQERIHELEAKVHELEAQVMKLNKKCGNQEAVIRHFIETGNANAL